MDDDGFFMGEIDGQRGLVPSNFLADIPHGKYEYIKILGWKIFPILRYIILCIFKFDNVGPIWQSSVFKSISDRDKDVN